MSGPFVVSEVRRDGVPCEVARYPALPDALDDQERRRARHDRRRVVVSVHDADDEERGYFERDGSEATITAADITPGTQFDTPFECGCVVVTAPDEDGSFEATDSDGVLAQFTVAMVETAVVAR